jgi:hypothetical protein
VKLNDIRSIPRARLVLVLGGSILVATLVTLGVLAATGMLTPTKRQVMIHDQGGAVMPFDLDRTTHVFRSTETGGIETVIVKDAADSAQITLIQQHLQHEATRFREGNFDDPAAIHGATMPGLADLTAGAANITFSYTALPDGAQISYETKDARLVDALHRWFVAQVADHGHDAISQ